VATLSCLGVRRPSIAFVLALGLMCVAVSCKNRGRPTTRVGSLPFPGPSTLFKAVSPEALGTHSYTRPRGDEASRGTVYTCRAGFLDLAHIRFTVDWTRYVRDRVRAALRSGSERLVIEGMDDTTYEVVFRLPMAWSGLDGAARDAASADAALRVAQRVALLIGTWHEILTYSGYKSTGILSEERSAFTYDDIASHVVGLQVADVALARLDVSYDRAVTEALDVRLRKLGVVDGDCLHEAIEIVRGTWWEGNRALVHQVPSSLETGSLVPLTVRGSSCCPVAAPRALELPPMGSELAEISIDSAPARELQIDRWVDAGPTATRFTEDDVLRILDDIRTRLDE
jgi:hypothetical protein